MNKRVLLYLGCILLAGCGLSPSPEDTKDSPKAAVEKDGAQTAIALPPSYSERPGDSSVVAALRPAKGPNVDTLFSEKLTDDDKRFDRLESAVLDLRTEFDDLKPSIIRLVAVESDIQDLINQLEILLQEDGNSAPPPAVVADKEPVPKVKAQQKNSVTVKEFRLGQHADKTRIVLDISKDTPYTLDLDNDEKLLVIELPAASWGFAKEKAFTSSLLASYSVDSMSEGAGSRVILKLKKPTEVLQHMMLGPETTPYFRLVIDLKP